MPGYIQPASRPVAGGPHCSRSLVGGGGGAAAWSDMVTRSSRARLAAHASPPAASAAGLRGLATRAGSRCGDEPDNADDVDDDDERRSTFTRPHTAS